MTKTNLEGAEAILTPVLFAGLPALRKERLPKAYRPAALDAKIRASRTRVEARLLHKAKLAGVRVPAVLGVGPYSITMGQLAGQTLHLFEDAKHPASVWKMAGAYLARLHAAQIVHGDYTPANLMLEKNGKLSVIDFGLGHISTDSEDYAVDVLTMKNALPAAAGKAFLAGYQKEGGKLGAAVLKLMRQVESRSRYQDRGAG